jgi:anaerobic selenocysteine-containing dehydrogenase
VLARSDKDIIDGELQFVSCENSMGVVQSSRGALKPVSDSLLSEPVLICRMAAAVLKGKTVIDWGKYEKHYDHIREEIAKVIPGCENYNEKVRQKGGFYLPNAAREQNFQTDTKKAKFTISPVNKWDLPPDELVMITIRSHDQFNTTIYGLTDRYRGIHNERRVVLMNKRDMDKRKLVSGDKVNIISNFNGQQRMVRNFIVADYPISEYCAATYYPETNALVPIDSVAEKSNTPTFKTINIRLEKVLSSE